MAPTLPTWVRSLSIIQRHSAPYIYSIFLVFGTIGCCLNILLLLCRRKFRTVTCCIYMAAASITMLINLSFGIGLSIYLLNPANAAMLSRPVSRIQMYLLQSCSMMYRWFLVAASFDRFALSSTNQYLRSFAKMRTARRTIIVIIIVWLILPLHNLIFDVANHHKLSARYQVSVLYYHSFFTVIAGCVLPASIMITCAFCIHHNLVLKRKRRQLLVAKFRVPNSTAKDQERKRDRQVLLLLIVQVVVFVITVIPLMISHFYNAVTLNMKGKSIERVAIERFSAYFASLTVYLFPTVSFYLYTMTSSMFRSEFKSSIEHMLTCKCFGARARIQPIRNDVRRITTTKY